MSQQLYPIIQVCAPGNSSEVVRELSKHPQVLSDVLSLSAASDRARVAAANEEPFDGPGAVPCIEALRSETACAVPEEDYQVRVRKKHTHGEWGYEETCAVVACERREVVIVFVSKMCASGCHDVR